MLRRVKGEVEGGVEERERWWPKKGGGERGVEERERWRPMMGGGERLMEEREGGRIGVVKERDGRARGREADGCWFYIPISRVLCGYTCAFQ